MYIWVVLATFLAMLASYTLSMRADIRKVAVEPMAEAEIAKLVSKHRAAGRYIYYNSPPNTPAEQVTFVPGIISDANIEGEMSSVTINDKNYTSQIFFMNKEWTTAYTNASDCDRVDTSKMLVTYGPIPYRWLNLNYEDVDVPNSDFMNAMRNTVSGGWRFGYTAEIDPATEDVTENSSGSPMRIITRDGELYVPLAIVNNDDFKKVCNVSSGQTCLIYLSGF